MSIKYLDNPICNFKPMGWEYKGNENNIIISTCFFKMNKHYKNFNIYINGLKRWIEYLNRKKYESIKFRIFIDQHVNNDRTIMSVIESCKKIEPILFECSNYMSNGYHSDVFGSLVRFYPMFDKEKNNNKIIIVDIDLHTDDYEKIDFFIDNVEKINGLCGFTSTYTGKSVPYIFAGILFSSEQFDQDLLNNFIKNPPDLSDKGFYGKRLTTYGYGIDEIFLNKIMIKNANNFYIGIKYQISYFLYFAKDYMKEKIPKRSYKCFKFILGKYYKKNMSFDNMYKEFDDELYNKTIYSEKAIYFGNRYFKLIDDLIKNKKTLMNQTLLKFTHKYLMNIYSAIIFIKIDVATNKTVNVKLINDIKL